MKKMLFLSAIIPFTIASSIESFSQEASTSIISLNELRKEVKSESKTINGTSGDNFHKLRKLGYSVSQSTPNKVLKYLLVIDRRFLEHQTNLTSRINTLKDASIIDSIKQYESYREPQYNRRIDNNILELYSYVSKGQINRINKSYFMQIDANNAEHYLDKLHECLMSKDSLVSRMEHLLADKRQLLEKKRKDEEEAKQREILREQAKIKEQNELIEQRKLEAQKEAEYEAWKEETLASLPSKETVRAKHRNYTHKTGHVFEMFPIGLLRQIIKV